MPNEGRVYFMLYGDDFDPDALPIGLRPTKTAHKGTPLPRESSWEFSGEKIQADYINIYEMSSPLVAILRPYAQEIRNSIRMFKLEAKLQVVLKITPNPTISTPAVGFDPDVISFLSEVGAYIDIDIYRGVD